MFGVESYNVVEIGPFGIFEGTVNGVSYAGGRNGPPWPCLGGGAINSILTLPNNPNFIWIASVNGGIWKTTDGGVNWVSITDLKVPSLSVPHISFDPTDSTFNTIVAAVGGSSNFGGIAGNLVGLYYTTNGGATWTVPDRSLFQDSGTQLMKAFKIGQRIVACIGGWADNTINTAVYVSESLGVPGSWTAKTPDATRCSDMVYMHSSTTFVAAIYGTVSFSLYLSSF